jgi:hypothetical protein
MQTRSTRPTAGRSPRSKTCVLLAALVVVPFASSCDDEGPPEDRVTTAEAAAGNAQTGPVAQALAQPITVRAQDAQGNAVRGARVEWQTATGSGTIVPIDANTDELGDAQATWTLGTAAGQQTATATIGTAIATFTATAEAGPAATVTINPAPIVLDAIGATQQAQIAAVDAHGNPIAGRAPTWMSNNTAVVTVNESGLITAVTPGSTTVRATLDGVSGETGVTVDPQPATILVDPPTAQLTFLGATAQFQASAVDRNGNPIAIPAAQFAWTSSNATILGVSATGLATAQGNGMAQVRASLGTLTGFALVTISQVATTLTLSPKIDTLTTAKPTVQLAVAAQDSNSQPIPNPAVTWTSTNNAIATVSSTGLVQSVSNGVVRIRAASGTASDSATITVRLNTAPKPLADTLGGAKDTQLVIAAPGLLANDTLGIPAGTITSFGDGTLGGAVTTFPAGTSIMFGTGGSLVVNANGSLTFMPSAGFTGNFTFLYRMQNAAGTGDAAVTIQVGVAPVAVDDAYSTQAGVPLSVAGPGVRGNDTLGFPPAVLLSFGGGSLPGTASSFPANSNLAFGVGGFIRINSDGSLSFTAPTGFTGNFTVLYRLGNSAGLSDGTITINVTPAPEPQPMPELTSAFEDQPRLERARTGSNRVARLAGSQDPIRPSATSTHATNPNVIGSVGLTSNSSPRIARASTSASTVPITSPIASLRMPSPRISLDTEVELAPSAMRTPISADRRATP